MTYRMISYNGKVVAKPDRRAPTADYDLTPRMFRQMVNASGFAGHADVQLHNGLQNGVASGKRWPYRGAGFLWTIEPRIPGQSRGDQAGFLVKGPSPYTWQNLLQAGPGSQPPNPGGPGTIAGSSVINPMTG